MKLVHSIPTHDAFSPFCAMVPMFKASFPSGLVTALLRMMQDSGDALPSASGTGVRGADEADAGAVGTGAEVQRDSGVAKTTGIRLAVTAWSSHTIRGVSARESLRGSWVCEEAARQSEILSA